MRCCLVLISLITSNALADNENRWVVSAAKWESADDVVLSREEISIKYQDRRQAISYDHEPVLVRSGSPASNGYFHRLDYRYGIEASAFSMTTNVGVHASSNMFQYFEFSGDALVATFEGRYALGEHAKIGVNGDYAFGDFHLYPVYAVEHTTDAKTTIRFTLPTRLSVDWGSLSLTARRYGQKWGTLDETRTIESNVYLDEWRIGVDYELPVIRGVSIGAGFSFNTEIQYLDLASGSTTAKLDDALFIRISAYF